MRLLVEARAREAAAPSESPAVGPDGERSYVAWLPPQGRRLIGLGAAVSLEGRLGEAELRQRTADTLGAVRVVSAPGLPVIEPRLIGGFAFAAREERFDPWRAFSDGRLVLPRWTYARAGEHAWLSLAIEGPVGAPARDRALAELAVLGELLERAAGPPAERRAVVPAELDGEAEQEWSDRITALARAIDEGLVSKVVAARCARLELARGVDPSRVLAHLCERFPACTGFYMEREDTAFLGATPERLVRLRGDEVATVALAGSAVPGEEEALLERSKDRHEHGLVVDDVTTRLQPLCREISAGETRVVRLRNVVHLETPIQARPEKGVGVLDLAAEFHPTPAVGGTPRRRALRWIEEHEPDDRGWYSGPFGWLDASGDGELAVALRCGVLRENRAWLYAGAGIVRGSDPEAEWTETELKMAPMREALSSA